jgi:hypothetical protein
VDASAILEHLENIGIQITIAGDKLQFRPGSAVPPELIPEIKKHKQELVALLKLKRYNFKYSDPQAADQEMEEIAARVEIDGYVLLWSTALCDLIAFYRDDESKRNILPGFIPYSVAELTELFGQGKYSKDRLRLIHEAKKEGAHIISQNPVTDVTVSNTQPKENTEEKRCYACGSTAWWHRADGEMICQRCHPKP